MKKFFIPFFSFILIVVIIGFVIWFIVVQNVRLNLGMDQWHRRSPHPNPHRQDFHILPEAKRRTKPRENLGEKRAKTLPRISSRVSNVTQLS